MTLRRIQLRIDRLVLDGFAEIEIAAEQILVVPLELNLVLKSDVCVLLSEENVLLQKALAVSKRLHFLQRHDLSRVWLNFCFKLVIFDTNIRV